MIEISFGKLVLLAIIALIVLGPEKLPGAARTAGALLRRVRSGWDNVRAEVERELQVEEIKRAAREAAARADAAQAELDAAVQKVRDIGSEAQLAGSPAAEPAVMRPLAATDAAAEGADESATDAVTDNRTGDLFAATKPPTESPHGHV
ncbi:Sec-independent protein translocase protein TatB [Rhodanobacter lindaniclasticus]